MFWKTELLACELIRVEEPADVVDELDYKDKLRNKFVSEIKMVRLHAYTNFVLLARL